MKTHDQNPHTDNIATLPAEIQQALEEVNQAKAVWHEKRRKQNEANAMAETIRKRRDETDAEAKALNKEWRDLFRKNQGVMTAPMKKLRTEVALGRETLEEFDELLQAHAAETEFLPWHTGDAARHYITQHNHLIACYANWLWTQFEKEHSQHLIQLLSLLKLTLGRNASAITGVVHSINDPETILKDFIADKITRPALRHLAFNQDDPFLRQVEVYADQQAQTDLENSPSPAARSRILTRRELKAKAKEKATDE
ncbi:septation initiation protein [Serratia sp. S1B]|nr:septation initiation protein [Serratia sp. S1B]